MPFGIFFSRGSGSLARVTFLNLAVIDSRHVFFLFFIFVLDGLVSYAPSDKSPNVYLSVKRRVSGLRGSNQVLNEKGFPPVPFP